MPLVLGALLLPHAAHAQSQPLTPDAGPQDYALVDMDRFPAVGEQAVQRGQATGRRRFLLGANTSYRLFKLDRASLRVGYVEFRSGPDGSRFEIPPVPLRTLSSIFDSDSDGVPTEVRDGAVALPRMVRCEFGSARWRARLEVMVGDLR